MITAHNTGMASDRQEHPRDNRLQTRLYLCGIFILLAGLGAAVLIFLAAGDAPEGIPEFDIEGSRRSLRDLELYGGKANVLATEFIAWFGGLWHGRSLAATVACIAVVLAGGLFHVAHNWLPEHR
ncbi:hypothetical protein [Geobacter sp. AOG2]|uniref:hypothetical protein n=1 Tax=Geobacter sp. AOG2 TaxID=1566347 RepID=UPI001CC65744|nr:hypothetical protein [Geobacter sp. AOG2]GFE60487.1 hypothetical protein AOG2_10750 [Geobacter sp. AOG2]